MTKPVTVEIVSFKAKADVSDEAVLKVVHATQNALQHYPGYIRRETLKNGDGQWIDIVHWRNLEDAQKAAETFNVDPSAAAFMEVVEVTSVNMLHLEQAAVFN
jgi:hypothetical protein